jgi:hypothetical protein
LLLLLLLLLRDVRLLPVVELVVRASTVAPSIKRRPGNLASFLAAEAALPVALAGAFRVRRDLEVVAAS